MLATVGEFGRVGGLGATGIGRGGFGARFPGGGGDFGDQRGFELGEGAFAHLRLAQRLADGFERVAPGAVGNVVGRAVDFLVVGIGVVREALEIENEQARATGLAGVADGCLEGGARGGKIDAVDAGDVQAHELFGRPTGQVEEGLAGGLDRDRPAVVLDDKDHGRIGADGLSHRLHVLALLGGAIADAAEDNRRAGQVADGLGVADGVQRVVADGADDRGDVEVALREMRAHLAAGGVRRTGGEEATEEFDHRHATRQHQGLVAVMEVEPVLLAQIVGNKRGRFVTGAGHMEVGEPLLDQGLFDTIHLACHEHSAV